MKGIRFTNKVNVAEQAAVRILRFLIPDLGDQYIPWRKEIKVSGWRLPDEFSYNFVYWLNGDKAKTILICLTVTREEGKKKWATVTNGSHAPFVLFLGQDSQARIAMEISLEDNQVTLIKKYLDFPFPLS